MVFKKKCLSAFVLKEFDQTSSVLMKFGKDEFSVIRIRAREFCSWVIQRRDKPDLFNISENYLIKKNFIFFKGRNVEVESMCIKKILCRMLGKFIKIHENFHVEKAY